MLIIKKVKLFYPLVFAALGLIGMMISVILHGAMDRFTTLLIPGTVISALLMIGVDKLGGNRSFAIFTVFLLNTGLLFQAIIDEKEVSHIALLYTAAPVIALMGVALICFLTAEAEDSRRRYPQILLFILVGAIYLLLFCIGVEVGGVKAWIRLGPVQFQATDITKLLTIVFWGLTLRDKRLSEKQRVTNCLILLGVNLFALGAISEFGTLLVLAITLIMMFFLYVKNLRITLISMAVLGVSALAGYWCVDKISERIHIWLHPEDDPYGAGYQLLEALRSIRLGGLFGDYDYGANIPVPDSDFAFASLVNCMGAVMGVAVIFGYALFFRAGMREGRNSDETVGTGLLISVMMSTLLSLAGSIGFLPTIGLPMAFLSYGGTNLAFIFLTVFHVIFTRSEKYETILKNAELELNRRAKIRSIRKGKCV